MPQLPDEKSKETIQQTDPPPDGKVSVIIPAYNEFERIEENILGCAATLAKFGYDYELVVVDDGSHDDTHLALLRAHRCAPKQIRIIRYHQNSGKGNALMCGSAYSNGKYVIFLDADMELSPEQIPLLFRVMKNTGCDAVIGSKRHPESNVIYPPIRRFYSTIYYALVKGLFGLPLQDTQTGLKLFRREVIEDVLPRLLAKRFAFDIELLVNAHSLGYKLIDAPVSVRFSRGFSRISASDVWAMACDTLAIFYRKYLIRYYDKMAGGRLADMECVAVSSELSAYPADTTRELAK